MGRRSRRRKKSKLEEFYERWKDVIEKAKACQEKALNGGLPEECKELDISDLALLDVYESLQYAEKIKEVISVVYELAWVKEWSGSSLVRYAIEEMISRFVSYGLVDKLTVKHAEAIAKYRKVKALFESLPSKQVRNYVLYHIINKILEIGEVEELEDGKVIVRIPKEKLIQMMYEPPLDVEAVLNNEVISKKIAEGFNKVYGENEKNGGEENENRS